MPIGTTTYMASSVMSVPVAMVRPVMSWRAPVGSIIAA